jgi:ATP-dependent DNA helicase RecQ
MIKEVTSLSAGIDHEAASGDALERQRARDLSQAREALRRVFGYSDFRGEQAEVICHVIGGGDALVLMPTGGGKSLCYQIPALVRSGLTVVISPLIALMQNQVAQLQNFGVAAAALNSTTEAEAAREIYFRIRQGSLKLLYVSPERLLLDGLLNFLQDVGVALIAIDEAHCVSQWGHDFRPEYQKLGTLRDVFPDTPRLALTATADQRTRAEIIDVLGLDAAREFVSSFDRPNLRLSVVEKTDSTRQLLQFVRGFENESGIVYALSRKRVDELAAKLQASGVRALAYHAGLDSKTRTLNQEQFLSDEKIVMVATIAFGMGIDKPDVRFVAHVDLPKSLEGYYQEIGRAGRDGLPAFAWMSYGLADLVQLKRFIEESNAPELRKRYERAQLDALLAYAESPICRRVPLLQHFGQSFAGACGNCDRCLTPIRFEDASESAQKFLSTIHRTGQRFGVLHLVNVLRGVSTEQVLRFAHHQLSVFAMGKSQSEDFWRALARQLVASGMVDIDHESYGALRLTQACRPLLRGEQPFLMAKSTLDDGKTGKSAIKKKSRDRSVSTGNSLLDVLRAWRKTVATAQSVPPYVIFHDATLLEIASTRPRSLTDLAGVTGIGEKKLERYGGAILDCIRSA